MGDESGMENEEDQWYIKDNPGEVHVLLVDLVEERQEIRVVPLKDITIYDFDAFKAKVMVTVDGAVYLSKMDYMDEKGFPIGVDRKKLRNITFTKVRNILPMF